MTTKQSSVWLNLCKLRYNSLPQNFKKYKELSLAVEARQRLDAQLSENELVRKVRQEFETLVIADSILQEFGMLTPENRVFKMVGPVLVKQDQEEAKSNVETRLDFIRSEM